MVFIPGAYYAGVCDLYPRSPPTECERALSSPALLLTRSRGAALEAEHLGGIAVLDANGNVIFGYGNIDRPFFPRSAVKLFHALPFLAGGAAASFGCSRAQIVLAASSQSGEAESRAILAEWQKRLNLPDSALLCGAEAPLSMRERQRLTRAGEEPSVLHNNNAGKHLAALTDALHRGEDAARYCQPDHPVHKRLIESVKACCDWDGETAPQAVDHCGMLACAIPLRHLALGMARLATGRGLSPAFAQAATDLRAAITSVPDHLAGPGRIVTQIMRLSAGRIIAKGGSEGVFTALDQRTGYGFAIKINDGSSEAASTVMVELLAAFHSLEADAVALLRAKTNPWRHPHHAERSQKLDFPFLARLPDKPGKVTPPSSAIAKDIITHKTRYGAIEHVNIPEDVLARLSHTLDHALEQLCAFLRLPIPPDVVVRILSRPQRSRMQGGTRRIFLSRLNLPGRAALIHELTHVLLGESDVDPARFSAVLTEGIAVYLQSRFGGVKDRSFPTQGGDLHDLLREASSSPPLVMDFDVDAQPEEDMAARRIAYLAAGSFVRFLVESEGVDQFLSLYHCAPEKRDATRALLCQKEAAWRKELGLN
jgi:L-asparaginase II